MTNIVGIVCPHCGVHLTLDPHGAVGTPVHDRRTNDMGWRVERRPIVACDRCEYAARAN
jgi:hypothetical protein